MTTDLRVLIDSSGHTARIVDGLHDVATALGDRRFAIVGGIAVLTHVQGHRVTQDIDAAARGTGKEIRAELLAVAEPDHDGRSDALLANGIPVDLLVAGHGEPRTALGRDRQAKRREATGHAIRWAIDTARVRQLACEPENLRGPVTLPVADVAGLLALKSIALTDPGRGEKATTDRLDVWMLLANDPDRAVAALHQLCDAPPAARRWAVEVLIDLLRDNPEGFVRSIARTGVGAPPSVADVDDVWQVVVEPHLDDLRR